MRRLLFVLLWVPRVWGRSEGLAVPQGTRPFRCLQISSFASSSRARTDCSAWLGELQTLRWSNDSDTFSFLKPWSRGNFSRQHWEQLQHLFSVYRSSFTRDVQEFVKMMHLAYPIQVQLSVGCEVHPGNVSEAFFLLAFQGSHVLSFQGTSWVPAPEAPPWVEAASKVLNQDLDTRETVHWLLSQECPLFVSGLLEAGKAELQKQVKPEAWLSSGPHPEPGRLLLVCHVSGFHPKPVWAMWMRGEQELPGAQPGDVLPQADGTWYLRVTLDVAAQEAAGLSCRVKHSSLGGQDLVLYWDGSHVSVGSVIGIVLACLALLSALLLGLAFWIRRYRSYEGI